MKKQLTGLPGRPAYEPSPVERESVKKLAAMGCGTDDIADYMGISQPTLRKHFYIELQTGRTQGRISNTGRLLVQANKGNVTAMIWLDKTRYGVREPDEGGKKEQRDELARTAHHGTEWDGLLPSTGNDVTVQ